MHFYDMDQCSEFRGDTGVYVNSSNVIFTSDMNGIKNPITGQHHIWPVSGLYIILIYNIIKGNTHYK